jgi:hypothetical protein
MQDEYIFNADEVPSLEDAPPEMRVNILMTQLLMTVEHLASLKKEIDIAMGQIMGDNQGHHDHHDHNHDHGDECCANPDCENKTEEE